MRDVLKEIKEKLKEIEEKENVKILLAIESGSRAWGFASPDSDYDVRFIYVRKPEDYLRLDEKKDMIEWQLDDVLDINGWDLKKALIQFRKGNVTLFEWSNSTIVYKKTAEWERIYEAAKSYFSMKAGIYHYYGTAQSTYSQYLQDEQVKYKKYFYALRPLLACRYIEEYKCPPPILFDDLMRLDMPDELRSGIEELLEKKKVTDEKDLNPQIPVVIDFISSELERQKELVNAMKDDRNKDWNILNEIFLNTIGSDSE
ncbi:nucleotidyltransferase domain-containing protein [Konateibacter massiliensis]|uniref:nucleotidyltransferase domain-containing protein n=1 Tax=Konateibacter massiliensis TaxID=2002841 RepID=UPI000C155EAF|nr:nucleotidyltransferase domain-containing protein [Konateibacter massiliensis]